MDLTLADVDSEVQRIADERTPELLPLLLERLFKRDALVSCVRHHELLTYYVNAQVALTRAKRGYFFNIGNQATDSRYNKTLDERNRIRKQYRSTPCTCYVQHR